jgi:hypothetical protein
MEYVALYEDFAKVEALTDDEESYHDLAQSSRGRTSKRFSSLDDAVAWASKAVNDYLTVYGCAEVREIEPSSAAVAIASVAAVSLSVGTSFPKLGSTRRKRLRQNAAMAKSRRQPRSKSPPMSSHTDARREGFHAPALLG